MGWITLASVVSFLVGVSVGVLALKLLMANPGSPIFVIRPTCSGSNIQFSVNPQPISPAECVDIQSKLASDLTWRSHGPNGGSTLTHPFVGGSPTSFTVQVKYGLSPEIVTVETVTIGPCPPQSSSSSSSSRSSSSRSSGSSSSV